MKLIGVACTNPEAVGYLYAQENGIYTTRDYRELYNLKELNMIIELTGRPEVADEISRTKPDYVLLMDHVAARLFWDIFQIQEQRIEERARAEGELRKHRDYLEELAREKTAELMMTNEQLQHEIVERKEAEAKTKLAYAELNQIFQTAADGMRVIDKDFNVLRINETFSRLSGKSEAEVVGKKCYEVFPGPLCHTPECPMARILGGEERVECEVEKERSDGTKIPCIVTATPFRGPGGEVIGIVDDLRDIAERKSAEQQREKLIAELQDALAKVRTLSGLLPICASCKKIRDDNGYWNQLEAYVSEHSEAEFTHSICPECARVFYGDLYAVEQRYE